MAASNTTTDPADKYAPHTAPRLIIEPSYTDPKTGAVYVHQDLVQVIEPYLTEAHIPPIDRTEKFGDVESWADYVKTFAGASMTGFLLTWSEYRLRAVLDYHEDGETPGRCRWIAEHPFDRSIPWNAWMRLADGQPKSQRAVLEALEDLAEDIVEPDAAALIGILRKLRATVNASADTELRADGSTRVAFTKDKTIQAGEVELPPEITIAIPVLKGHVERDEVEDKTYPVLYRLAVRVRVSIDNDAHLAFRLSMPGAERALEAVFADRVKAAKALLGDGYSLLRATGGG